MNGFDLIFYAIFAAFMAYRLFSALGKEDHNPDPEKQAKLKEQFDAMELQKKTIETSYKVVEEEHVDARLLTQVNAIKNIDPEFRLDEFVQGAEGAFSIIIESFCSGDKDTLKHLLDSNNYKSFSAEIDRRNKLGEIHECAVVSVNNIEVESVELKGKEASIVVKIDSEQIEVVKDKEGNILEGDPSITDNVTDIWTFSKNLSSKDPNWLLVEASS